MVQAQVFVKEDKQGTVATNSFWSNWFIQADLDMSLQNPYGYDFRDVFPNGKSFGGQVVLPSAGPARQVQLGKCVATTEEWPRQLAGTIL